MKVIVVKVHKVDPNKFFGYTIEMRVITSSHPRFVVGHRWDWGFQEYTLREGYTTILIPTDEILTLKGEKE